MSVSTALAPVTMREALSDPALLGAVPGGQVLARLGASSSSRPWARPLDGEERTIFQRLTGRPAEPLTQRVEELLGRLWDARGGKSRAIARPVLSLSSVFVVDHSPVLVIGERPVVLLSGRRAKSKRAWFSATSSGILESMLMLAEAHQEQDRGLGDPRAQRMDRDRDPSGFLPERPRPDGCRGLTRRMAFY